MAPTGLSSIDVLLDGPRRSARSELAEAMRSMSLPEDAPDAAVPDDAFLEPRFFSQLAQPTFELVSVDQLLLAHRAEGELAAQALTDGAGTVHLPGVGTCRTTRPTTEVTLRLDAARSTVSLAAASGAVETYPIVPASFVPGTGIEVVRHLDPVLAGFLDLSVPDAPAPVLVADPGAHVDRLAEALSLVDRVRPDLSASLRESVRSIVLFRHPSAESFAALAMHGMIFVNVEHGESLAFLVEHLVHQGGHVLFSEATLHRGDFLAVDPETELGTVTSTQDRRDLYGAFHGLFTEHVEVQVFAAALASGAVPEGDVAEFREHLVAVAARHEDDLSLMEPHAGELFTGQGRAVVAAFRAAFDEVRRTSDVLPDVYPSR